MHADADTLCWATQRVATSASPDGTSRAFALASPKRDEREVGVQLLERAKREVAERS
jgi:hypothetical protein